MIKGIKYSGYTAQPSDYECPDGQLAAAINVVPEDGALNNIHASKPVLFCNLGGTVKLIHHVFNQDNYIITRNNDSSGDQDLYWLVKSSIYSTEDDAVFIGTFRNIIDIAIMGNTIILASDEGLRYILWKDYSYTVLGSKPPFVHISFGMTLVDACTDIKDLNINFVEALGGIGPGSIPVRPDDSEENANAIYGFLLSTIKEKIVNKGYFYMPFFVRYAFRLFDGSYSWHSAPVLMLPMVIPPIMMVGNYNMNTGIQNIPTKLNIPYFSLDYAILDYDETLHLLNDWKDLIAGIDIFISAPIYTYDQSKRVCQVTDERSVLLNSYYDWNPDDLDLRVHPDVVPDQIFVGHYAASRTGSSRAFNDILRPTDGTSAFSVWKLPKNEHFHDEIKDTCNFYKIASLDLNAITDMTEYKRLPLDSTDLDSLVTRPMLPDDYQSHCDLFANSLLSFNSRLNLASLHMSPAKPFPLKSAVQASTSVYPQSRIKITVYTRINGVLCSVKSDTSSNVYLWDLIKYFPRYIYYPDANAYKMKFEYDSNVIIIDLTPHDFLNGAYWYGSLAVDSTPSTQGEPETKQTSLSAPLGNKIYTSEVNNPFVFPINGINTIGTSFIRSIATAAKALSQGQFGHFPLYAFTTDGVWALEVGANGFYTARQPITRDVILENSDPLQIDSAVLFATERGIMLISGSQTQCISDNINAREPFDVLKLPGMDKLHSMLGDCADMCMPTASFLEYISDCGMIYDYVHQRVIVYNPYYTYAYVFSLKSKEWGMMHSNIKCGVNSYPDALAIDQQGVLLNFSSSEGEPTKGLFVTRPLKLDSPDILKTIDTVIQRGYFLKGHVQSVLYGSRDLINWHLIWSSKDHYLRGFRGTPYKYFRIACITSLSENESIYGATIQFTPRMLNQPR